MRFIITENKLEQTVFKYLDTIFRKVKFEGDVWFSFRNSRQVVATYETNRLRISSFGVHEISEMFSMEYFDAKELLIKYILSELGKNIFDINFTPYKLFLPDYIQ